MPDLNALLGAIEAEARRKEFPIDRPVYEAVDKDPLVPIAYGGNFEARVCSFGRDPGRDEIKFGQPQVGAAGKLVRKGVLTALGKSPHRDDPRLQEALQYIFLSNTVPYKPPGNKAYPDSVKERFRPYIAELLHTYWKGDVVITLGTEAFQWFAPYAPPGKADEFWKREDRYEAELPCVLTVETNGGKLERPIKVCPLPHPSPLNQRWIRLFPGLLEARLKRWLVAGG